MHHEFADESRLAMDSHYAKGFWMGTFLVLSIIIAYHAGKKSREDDYI